MCLLGFYRKYVFVASTSRTPKRNVNSRVGGGLDFVSRLLDKICARSSDNKRILQNYHDERLKTQTSANSKLNLAEEK